MGLLEKSGIVLGAIVVILLITLIGYEIKYIFTEGSEIITIKDKWVKPKGNDAKYLVSSTDGQVFQITDSWLYWRWYSSNVYDSITIGKTYEITTQGFRFGFMSDYKNIITLKEVR